MTIENIYREGTQKHKVLEMLKQHPAGLNGRDFLQAYIPEYRSRINELRRDGYDIPEPKHEADSKFVRFKLLGYSPLFVAA